MKNLFVLFFMALVALLSSCSSLIEENGKTYQYVSTPVSWDVAKTLAEEAGGRLAVFKTPEELANVEVKIPQGQIAWVGLSDAEAEGRWKWIDGSPLRRDMIGKLALGGNLEARDYGYILLQGGLGARAKSGVLPRASTGKPEVDGYLIEFL